MLTDTAVEYMHIYREAAARFVAVGGNILKLNSRSHKLISHNTNFKLYVELIQLLFKDRFNNMISWIELRLTIYYGTDDM